MSTIHIDDFLPGDIMLFKVDFADPKTEWISKAIALLTKSDVSHAALYMGNSILSDEGLSGLACHKISEDNADRPLYIRRLENPADMSPVLNHAEQYIKCNEPYDKPALLLVGLILLYRDCPIHLLPVDLVTRILAMAAAVVDEYLAKILYPGKKPMVCSQYVFQCFEDAGSEYQLQLPEDCIAGQYSLIEHVHKTVTDSPTDWSNKPSILQQSAAYEEKVIADFVKHLQAIEAAKPTQFSFELHEDIIHSVLHFSDKLHTLLHINNNSLGSVEKLSMNAASKSLFVTPADLKLCTNLSAIGDSSIYRDSENQAIKS